MRCIRSINGEADNCANLPRHSGYNRRARFRRANLDKRRSGDSSLAFRRRLERPRQTRPDGRARPVSLSCGITGAFPLCQVYVRIGGKAGLAEKYNYMKHIGLFEGIGGFSLAGRWMGWETIAWCEWDTFCQRVLKYHFPSADAHGDITTTDFTRYAGQVDILTGGFPCQPYSSAGKRLGKEDDRHLWPEMLRAIREIQPRWVVGENVRGLTNWNGGLVFDEVQADLENEGYEVTPYLLPAAATNAPHERDRVWFVAHSNKIMLENAWLRPGESKGVHKNSPRQTNNSNEFLGIHEGRYCSGLCEFDGVPKKLDGITVSAWRRKSIGAYGNAIVPQVAYQIFRAISNFG